MPELLCGCRFSWPNTGEDRPESMAGSGVASAWKQMMMNLGSQTCTGQGINVKEEGDVRILVVGLCGCCYLKMSNAAPHGPVSWRPGTTP